MKLQERVERRRIRRKYRVRNQVRKTGRLRLTVFRSNRQISVQIIDDVSGNTLVSASSLEKEIIGAGKYGGNVETAKKVGSLVAERAKAKDITEVAFDRGSYRFHGRVKALADAAREGGLKF